MRRIYWAAEAQDAQIVEALLRSHGIDAWAFDPGIVRLDWFKTIAFGGCRVMVADADAEQAHRVVAAFRHGELALADEEIDRPCCPHCHCFDCKDDPRPRRIMFLILLISDPIFTAMFLLLRTSPAESVFVAACMAFNITLIFPGIAAWAVKSRFRCGSCRHAWRAPPQQSFREMSRSVEGHSNDSDFVAAPAPATP